MQKNNSICSDSTGKRFHLVIEETDKIPNKSLHNQNHFLYHTNSWQQFIQDSFNLKNDKDNRQLFITAKNTNTNKIETILPLTVIKSKIFGNKIISSAYQEYGGFLGKKEHIPKILEHIKKNYKDSFQFLEIRGAIDKENNPENTKTLIKKLPYKRAYIKIDQNDPDKSETTWKNIQKAKRKAIKKAKKHLISKELTIADLDQFYNLYLDNMKSFGTPPYSKKYFHNFFTMFQEKLCKVQSKGLDIQKEFPKDNGKIFGTFIDKNKDQASNESKETNNKNSNLVLTSALLGFITNNKVHITTALTNKKYKQFRPGDLAHWNFIEWSTKNNITHFDFGTVREGSGHLEYKRKWGVIINNFPNFYLPLKQKTIETKDQKEAGIFKLAAKVWQKIPTKLTKYIGMRLRKELGL